MIRPAWAILIALLAVGPTEGARAQQLGEAARAVLEGRVERHSIEITDEFGDYVRRSTGSSSRVYADVSAIKTYRQPGCKRLRVLVRAPEAVAIDPDTGKPASFSFTC